MPERIVQLPPLPARPIDGHKGLFGRVLIVGGSEVMVGAPVLAGTAALKMGAGLVQLAVPKNILHHCLSITPELIGAASFNDAVESADAIVLGPGLGQADSSRKRVLSLCKQPRLMVIDADALNILAAGKKWPGGFKAQAILTPHPGEMRRLNRLLGRKEVPKDDRGRIELATFASTKFKQVLVLKGHRTVVADGSRVYVNRTGNSALSKAGTGDVLSGIIAALLGQKMDRFEAACMGVWLHGRAGELAGQKLGLRSVLATDVIKALPAAIMDYERHFG